MRRETASLVAVLGGTAWVIAGPVGAPHWAGLAGFALLPFAAVDWPTRLREVRGGARSAHRAAARMAVELTTVLLCAALLTPWPGRFADVGPGRGLLALVVLGLAFVACALLEAPRQA